jgi:hypothetical protein
LLGGEIDQTSGDEARFSGVEGGGWICEVTEKYLGISGRADQTAQHIHSTDGGGSACELAMSCANRWARADWLCEEETEGQKSRTVHGAQRRFKYMQGQIVRVVAHLGFLVAGFVATHDASEETMMHFRLRRLRVGSHV